ILDTLKDLSTPIILLINKIDKLNKEDIAKLINKYADMDLFQEIIPVSALEDISIDRYIDVMENMLPEGHQYFPEDMITDEPERSIIAELVRENALLNLEEEVPHGSFVEIDSREQSENKDLIDIYATIY